MLPQRIAFVLGALSQRATQEAKTLARFFALHILVIDDFGAGFFPELVHYRNRLLGFYRINGDQVEAQTLSVHLPKRFAIHWFRSPVPSSFPRARSLRSAWRLGPPTASSIYSTTDMAVWSSGT